MTEHGDPVDFYTAHADRLRAAWDGIAAADFLAPVQDHLPARPVRILDVGAGIGTVAAWLSARGHDVIAAEPVTAFHGADGPAWIDARLPNLEGIEGQFELILGLGVWQHIAPEDRRPAMERLSAALAPRGQLVLALRHGAVPDSRPIWDNPTDEVIDLSRQFGLGLVSCRDADAVQAGNRAAGVRFTWLVLTQSG